MKGSKGYRRGTRNLKVGVRDKGKVKIRRYMQEFKEGDVVAISIDPSYQKIPHPRFQGKGGRIVGTQGSAYYVGIRDKNKRKKILVTPNHLTALKPK
ncbi:MAG: 50S ribosomal protein L21e [Candidatus Altiarchaeales archaeon]|nr:50S ribosomal protein L21e [Candidatus Altiarchaeales archaeon]